MPSEQITLPSKEHLVAEAMFRLNRALRDLFGEEYGGANVDMGARGWEISVSVGWEVVFFKSSTTLKLGTDARERAFRNGMEQALRGRDES